MLELAHSERGRRRTEGFEGRPTLISRLSLGSMAVGTGRCRLLSHSIGLMKIGRLAGYWVAVVVEPVLGLVQVQVLELVLVLGLVQELEPVQDLVLVQVQELVQVLELEQVQELVQGLVRVRLEEEKLEVDLVVMEVAMVVVMKDLVEAVEV